MKYLKVIELFAIPTAFTGLLFFTMYNVGDNAGLFPSGVNVIPMLCAICFFAWFAFFVGTANALYPDGTITLPIKRDLIPTSNACTFTIVKYYHSPVTNQLTFQTV